MLDPSKHWPYFGALQQCVYMNLRLKYCYLSVCNMDLKFWSLLTPPFPKQKPRLVFFLQTLIIFINKFIWRNKIETNGCTNGKNNGHKRWVLGPSKLFSSLFWRYQTMGLRESKIKNIIVLSVSVMWIQSSGLAKPLFF